MNGSAEGSTGERTKQDRTSRDQARQKETEGWLVFDSLMLTSTGSISLIERATAGNVEEAERARERRRAGGGTV